MSSRKKSLPTTPPSAGAAAALEPGAPGGDVAGLFWEDKVAAHFGVTRERLGGLRRDHLVDGEHWRTVRGAVVYTAAGLDVLAAVLRGEGQDTPPAGKIAPEPTAGVLAGPPARKHVLVRRVPGNRRLLLCADAAAKAAVQDHLVWVKDNTRFRPGMRIEVQERADRSWQFVGPMPRAL